MFIQYIYLQSKLGLTILVDLHTNYLIVLFKDLLSLRVDFSLMRQCQGTKQSCYIAAKQRRRENRRKSKNEIKDEILKSLINGEIVENKELNLKSENVKTCVKAITIVK